MFFICRDHHAEEIAQEAFVELWRHWEKVRCQDPRAPSHGVEVFDAEHHLLAHSTETPYASAPVFMPDGTVVVVTSRGAVVEARIDVAVK